jgi:hypothetical protein
MKNNPINKGVVSNKLAGIGPVSRKMVQQRASELALIAGRPRNEIHPADYEQAKRELAGQPDIDRQDEALNALPESKRWDPVPGSAGRETPGAESEDMDDEGRSETEQLVEQGSEEAVHDQMLNAASDARRADGLEPSTPSRSEGKRRRSQSPRKGPTS